MASRPQAARTIEYPLPSFEQTSSIAPRLARAKSLSCPSILLVGRNGSWGSPVLKTLEKLGSVLSFEVPQNILAEQFKRGSYDIILLDSTVMPAQRRELAARLAGTHASIFYTFPVENGCWWLPALRDGQDCHGAPAFRRKEFPLELERMVRARTES